MLTEKHMTIERIASETLSKIERRLVGIRSAFDARDKEEVFEETLAYAIIEDGNEIAGLGGNLQAFKIKLQDAGVLDPELFQRKLSDAYLMQLEETGWE